jgi:o-succinylbenzoate synthase
VIERLELTPYRLPLRRTWQSARGVYQERTGWLVCAHADGLFGYGDCAPLPEAGTEDNETALAALTDWRTRAVGQPLERVLDWIEADRAPAPAARYAVECALLDLAAQRASLPLRLWLDPAARDSVEVNATLGAPREATPETILASCRSGFRVLKIKVGLETPSVELRRLAALARRLPAGTTLRLDANGAWSLDDASRMLDALNALPIESLEEPLRRPTSGELKRLQSSVAYPLALDETLHRSDGQIDLEALPVRRIVLKPAVVGGLRRTQELATRAAGLGIQVVLTSLIETAAGIWPSVQLAAAIPSRLAHGLATSGWLARDLGDPPATARGGITLGKRPGGGFHPKHAVIL